MITRIKTSGELAKHKMLGYVELRYRIYEDGDLLGYTFVTVKDPMSREVTSKEIETVDINIIYLVNKPWHLKSVMYRGPKELV